MTIQYTTCPLHCFHSKAKEQRHLPRYQEIASTVRWLRFLERLCCRCSHSWQGFRRKHLVQEKSSAVTTPCSSLICFFCCSSWFREIHQVLTQLPAKDSQLSKPKLAELMRSLPLPLQWLWPSPVASPAAELPFLAALELEALELPQHFGIAPFGNPASSIPMKSHGKEHSSAAQQRFGVRYFFVRSTLK